MNNEMMDYLENKMQAVLGLPVYQEIILNMKRENTETSLKRAVELSKMAFNFSKIDENSLQPFYIEKNVLFKEYFNLNIEHCLSEELKKNLKKKIKKITKRGLPRLKLPDIIII